MGPLGKVIYFFFFKKVLNKAPVRQHLFRLIEEGGLTGPWAFSICHKFIKRYLHTLDLVQNGYKKTQETALFYFTQLFSSFFF